MNNMDELYGLEFDHGKVRGILTLEKSQKTAAITEQQAEIDTRWGGKCLTTVRLTPKTDDWVAGLDLMANKAKELSINWRRFHQAEYPGDRLTDLDAVLNAAQSEGSFPCIVNRPMESLISAGIGKNSGVIRALVGVPEAPTFVGSLFSVLSTRPTTKSLPSDWNRLDWTQTNDRIKDLKEGTFADGKPWRLCELTWLPAAARESPGRNEHVVLVPLEAGGAAPFVAEIKGLALKTSGAAKGDTEWQLNKETANKTVVLKYPLRWSITYIQNDVRLSSPVKTLIAGAAITHLLQYLEGKKVSAGAHEFKGDSPIDICRRILGFLYRQAVDKYMFNPVEKFWDGDDAKLIQAILDFCYALDRKEQLMVAVAARPDVTMFMDTILLSGLSKAVVKGQVTVPPIDDEFAEWLVHSVLSMYAFEPGQVKFSRYKGKEIKSPEKQWINNFIRVDEVHKPKGLTPEQDAAWDSAFPTDGSASLPTPYTFDYVSTDYVANALATMLRNAIPIVLKALRGEWPGISVIQYSGDMVDLDVTVSILEALDYALKMDTSCTMNKAQFTLPYRSLFWGSLYATFTTTVPRSPVTYSIMDLTAGLDEQSKAFASLLDGGKSGKYSELGSIFQYGGFSYLRYGPDLDAMMMSELAPGVKLPEQEFSKVTYLEDDNSWLTNAPMAHGDVEVSVIVPCWDESAWRIYANYLQSQTLKTYFAFPVTDQLCQTRKLTVNVNRLAKWVRDLMHVLGLPTGLDGQLSSEVVLSYPSFPALFDTALIIPYIREYEHQKLSAQDLDHSMEIELDPANSYWNMSGTLLLPERQPDVPGVASWRVPSYSAGFAGKRTPSGMYSQPVVFNAQR